MSTITSNCYIYAGEFGNVLSYRARHLMKEEFLDKSILRVIV